MRRSCAVSRRGFLKRAAGLTAAAAAVPYLVPRHVLAAAGRSGANDTIQVGYIGAGRRAHQLMSLPKNGRIVAAADAYLPRAEEVATKYGGKAYQDYRRLLESKDVDAIFAATPDHWRALTVIHACQAGKDVYAEKPMSLTIREGRLMVEAARKYGRVFQTGSQQRSMAINRLGCELVRTGRIGQVTKVVAANYPSPWEGRLAAQPVIEGLDWDMWCGPTEPVPYNTDLFTPRAKPGWISFRPYSGGEVTGWGAHGLDQVQWALGTDDTGPVDIWTEGGSFDPPTYTEPEARTRGEKICSLPQVLMRYANGTVLEFGDGPPGGARFIGEKGTITIDRGKLSSNPREIAEEAMRAAGIRPSGQEDHIGNWFECIVSREPPVADVEIGHRSTTVCHLGNIARWCGRRLKWDPAQEAFAGDAEANALLDRPRRAAYQLPERV